MCIQSVKLHDSIPIILACLPTDSTFMCLFCDNNVCVQQYYKCVYAHVQMCLHTLSPPHPSFHTYVHRFHLMTTWHQRRLWSASNKRCQHWVYWVHLTTSDQTHPTLWMRRCNWYASTWRPCKLEGKRALINCMRKVRGLCVCICEGDKCLILLVSWLLFYATFSCKSINGVSQSKSTFKKPQQLVWMTLF